MRFLQNFRAIRSDFLRNNKLPYGRDRNKRIIREGTIVRDVVKTHDNNRYLYPMKVVGLRDGLLHVFVYHWFFTDRKITGVEVINDRYRFRVTS